MPRDSSGNYTLPPGNPVVAGTIIDVSWANPTMADIAVQLNGVMTRDGLLGPTAQIAFVDGTPANPGIKFQTTPATGFFTDLVNNIALSAGGVERFRWGTTKWVSTTDGVVNGNLGVGVDPDPATKLQVRKTAPAASPVWQVIDSGIFQATASCIVHVHAGATGGTIGYGFTVGAVRNRGALFYTTSSDTMTMHAGSTQAMSWTSSVNKSLVEFQTVSNARFLAGAESAATFIVVDPTNSGATPNTNADSLLIDGPGNIGMSFLGSPTSVQQILFGRTGGGSGNAMGVVSYNHNTDALGLGAGGAARLIITSTTVDSTLPIDATTSYSVNGTKVVGTRRTGWAAATGTATRTTFATSTVTLPVLAEHVKALIDDLIAHGLIGT